MHVSLFHWNHTIDLISAKLFLVYYGMRDKRNLRKMRFSDSRVIVAWINRGDEYIGLYESVGTGTNKALLSEDAPYRPKVTTRLSVIWSPIRKPKSHQFWRVIPNLGIGRLSRWWPETKILNTPFGPSANIVTNSVVRCAIGPILTETRWDRHYSIFGIKAQTPLHVRFVVDLLYNMLYNMLYTTSPRYRLGL